MCLKRHREASANKAARANACQGALGLALRKAKQTALAAARSSSKNPLPAGAGSVAAPRERRPAASPARGPRGEHRHALFRSLSWARERRVEFTANLGRWEYTKKKPSNNVFLNRLPRVPLPLPFSPALSAPFSSPRWVRKAPRPLAPAGTAPCETPPASLLKGTFLSERVPGSSSNSSAHFRSTSCPGQNQASCTAQACLDGFPSQVFWVISSQRPGL